MGMNGTGEDTGAAIAHFWRKLFPQQPAVQAIGRNFEWEEPREQINGCHRQAVQVTGEHRTTGGLLRRHEAKGANDDGASRDGGE